MLKTRVFGGTIVTILYVVFAYLGGYWLLFATFALGLAAMYEMYNVAGITRYPPTYLGYLTLAVIYFTAFRGADYRIEMLIVLIVLTLFVINHKRINVPAGYITFSAILYPGLLTVSIYLLREMDIYYMVLLIVASWCTDVGAYFAGRSLGRHHIFSVLSPKKTAEGCAGGIISACLLSVLAALICKRPVAGSLILCFIGSICSELGDLAASAVKRKFNKKDYGNIIPGHGGVMDRFDSMIFTAAVMYCLSVIL